MPKLPNTQETSAPWAGSSLSVCLTSRPSVDDTLAFDSSPEYTALKVIHDKSTKWRSFVVEGLPLQCHRANTNFDTLNQSSAKEDHVDASARRYPDGERSKTAISSVRVDFACSAVGNCGSSRPCDH